MAKEKVTASQEGEIDPAEAQGAPAEVAGSAKADKAASAKPTASAKADKANGDQVIVRVSGKVPQGPVGGHHRVFSKDEHGDDFKAQAKAYAERFDGTVVDALPQGKVCPTCKRPV